MNISSRNIPAERDYNNL